jgi:hypothetical protein
MYLIIPSYQTPQHSTPIVNAIGWITYLNINWFTSLGSIRVSIHPDVASMTAGLSSLDEFAVQFGEVFIPANPDAEPPVEEVHFPTLAELDTLSKEALASDSTLAPFEAIKKVSYDNLLLHPKLKDAMVQSD